MRYIAVHPMQRLPRIIDLAEKIDRGGLHATAIRNIRQALLDENSNWRKLAQSLCEEVDVRLLQRFVRGYFINANLQGEAKAREVEKRYGCNVPWAVLMDPTSACNLSCTGCWAAEYGGKSNLSYETMDSICRQGENMGAYFYIFSGGEPLVRKKDILRLCRAHPDSYFFAFTNGTLVDEAFCRQVKRAGNFALAFSIEGDEASTDMRRGAGTYRKVINAMALMRKHRLMFGYSTCYHRYNTESVGSDAFVDDMISRGCRFVWNFTYMPIGKNAPVDLLAAPEQRAYMYRRVREIRETKPIFALDFWNDGEYVNGCIAGGRRYLHINANGDVEPCAFIHYSNVNIHDVTLLEALQSPIFMAYRKRQPFNGNPLRPCPLLDNPEALNAMVKESGAHSTDMREPEDIDDLCAKTADAAAEWAQVADSIRAQSEACRACAGCEKARA
jgi:MoaA/NifB/PqqE/SkfB family radical SAM enzyme